MSDEFVAPTHLLCPTVPSLTITIIQAIHQWSFPSQISNPLKCAGVLLKSYWDKEEDSYYTSDHIPLEKEEPH